MVGRRILDVARGVGVDQEGVGRGRVESGTTREVCWNREYGEVAYAHHRVGVDQGRTRDDQGGVGSITISTGSSQDDGIYILVKEIVDNSIDEFVMGNGKQIDIHVKDGVATILVFALLAAYEMFIGAKNNFDLLSNFSLMCIFHNKL